MYFYINFFLFCVWCATPLKSKIPEERDFYKSTSDLTLTGILPVDSFSFCQSSLVGRHVKMSTCEEVESQK